MDQESPKTTDQEFIFRNSMINTQQDVPMPSVIYEQQPSTAFDGAQVHPRSPLFRGASPPPRMGSPYAQNQPSMRQGTDPVSTAGKNLSIFPSEAVSLRDVNSDASRATTPLVNFSQVTPAFDEVHNFAAAKQVKVSRPITPRGFSERASLSNQNSPRSASAMTGGIVMNEKPHNSRSRLGDHSPSGTSFTSTVHKKASRNTLRSQPTFAHRVFAAGKPDLLYNLKQSSRFPWKIRDEQQGILDLSTLMRMQQHVLQQKLIEQVRLIGEKGAWMEIGVGDTLKEYCQTARDLEYMLVASSSSLPDPFLLSTSDALQSLLLEEGHLVSKRPHPELDDPSRASRLPVLRRVPLGHRRLRRVLAVFAAAVALLVPFLVAAFVVGEVPRLVLGCVCIALFGLGISITLVPTVVAMLATLGYAAAVVVFFGVIGRPGTPFGVS